MSSSSYYRKSIFLGQLVTPLPLPTFHSRPLSDLHVEFASAVGCPSTRNSAETLSCLQKVPKETLHEHLYLFDECNAAATELMAFPAIWRPANDFADTRDGVLGISRSNA